MNALLAFFIALLFASGTWLLLGQRILRQVIGLVLISHGANLMLLLAGGLAGKYAPLLTNPEPRVDPLPQALILTAIVISFGITAFLLALGYRMQALEEDEG
ncbi:MAG: NADH-quinone oxidoreductase subunit K [Armatimonadota bacterium]|nr:NADH-quinone oxidoreductase subunit K [Armatimonadota bacterium]MDR5690251.1 NADH-quinone oxidoreductase subunit K [Armatimonadota bacterium]MDR7392457.1 NADH-quinone oxidoreductase subunit K [Armatimonadota bacterium]MDR7600447.1 NADH-quinone oxidoreductase subunit K [Armatimonadota bacterium]